MVEHRPTGEFPALNRAYNATFQPRRLSIGLVVPIERYEAAVPTMAGQLERIQQAEALGFAAVWLRDVPFHVASVGDAGQLYDPFVYLGAIAATTTRIGLGVASLILPFRHPIHIAKAAASVDDLSGGRLLLGVASGDRPSEYPAFGIPFEERGERFAAHFEAARSLFGDESRPPSPNLATHGMELLPKPKAGVVPMLLTGASQQHPDWIADHGDGWMTYPRPTAVQQRLIAQWRATLAARRRPSLPAMQPLYLDLADAPNTPPTPIHLGLRTGIHSLCTHLEELREAGVNHVALNLRFNQSDLTETLERIAIDVLPQFHSTQRIP